MFTVVAWMLLFGQGRQLPFLHTEAMFRVRAYVIFPLLLVTLAWFSFFHKWEMTGRTGYRMAMSSVKTTGQRIKLTALALLGLFVVSGTLAWTAVAVPIWFTVALGKESSRTEYRVVQVTGSGRFREAHLTRLSDGEQVTLPLTRGYASIPIRAGEVVCATLKTSITGALVTELQSGGCR
jgi:hypothetical protein